LRGIENDDVAYYSIPVEFCALKNGALFLFSELYHMIWVTSSVCLVDLAGLTFELLMLKLTFWATNFASCFLIKFRLKCNFCECLNSPLIIWGV
jgi:hypothetical protein